MRKGRAPCCDKTKVKKGPWSPAEDLRLIAFIQRNGHENWRSLPKLAGLARCGKSCRLRWINYLRPDVKRGNFTLEEEDTIMRLHKSMGNKWSKIASYFPGRTDNEIKNVWNTHLKKRAENMERLGEGDEVSSKDVSDIMTSSSSSSSFSSSCNKGKRKTDPELDCEQNKRIKTVPLDDTNIDVCNMVNKPLGEEDNCTSHDLLLHDVPNLEADFDFWSMLDMDNLGSYLQTSNAVVVQDNIVVDDHHKCSSSSKEAEQSKWLKHLETELGLEATKEEDELWMANSQIWPELVN